MAKTKVDSSKAIEKKKLSSTSLIAKSAVKKLSNKSLETRTAKSKPTKLSKKAILDEPHEFPEVETQKEAPKKDKKRKADKKLAGVEVELEGVSKAIKKVKRKVEDKADQVDEKPVEAKSSGKSKKRKVNAEVITKSPPSKKSPKVTPTTASQAKLDTSKKSRKQKKYRSPSPAPEPEESEGVDEDIPPNSEVVDEEPSFFGFSTDDDDDDSSDEEGMGAEIPGIDISKLPTIAKDDATVKRRLEKAKRKPTEDRGVIYLGRIPHGFHEDQMRGYFNQFGDVTRLRLSRNKRTGHSKHYGYLEFDSSSVAQIVAETMDNYLLMGHILRCKVVPKDEVHPDLWIGANRKWRAVPNDRVARVQHNKARTEDQQKKVETRLLQRQKERKRKIAEAGIEYDFDTVAYKKSAKPTKG